MADDCISVYFETTNNFWTYCWSDATPDPTWSPIEVTTGLRKSQGTTQRAWRTCQYYMKGLPAICVWWTEGAPSDPEGTTTSGQFYCSYVKENTSDNPQDPIPAEPSGFNFTQCDFLGRRQWCDKYEKSVDDDLEEWTCAAPNPYLTGLGKKSLGDEAATFAPIPRDDIWGFNDINDGTGKGLCDCHGMGRGPAGCARTVVDGASSQRQSEVEEEIQKIPLICNYYRPYQMGFGIIDPAKKLPGDYLLDGTITEQGWNRAQEWEANVEYRLPLNYEMYNHRAKFQKCQWWAKDSGSDYIMDGFSVIIEDEAEGDPFEDDSFGGKIIFCENTDTAVAPYNHRLLTASGGSYWVEGSSLGLENVWAPAGGPVCNGCRPDCPGYSGRWVYITNDKMLPGMPVTANQILELRFWSSEWDTKEDYDKYYEQKPNFDDARTSALFTFTKWQHLDVVEPDKSIMLGKKLDLCLPAPINDREFTREYVTEEEITYANVDTYGKSTGTNAPEQYHFPSLVRNPQFLDMNPLTILYPYYNDDIFDIEICVQQGPAGHIKRHNTIYGDSIRTIGYTLTDKKVYIINTTEVPIDSSLRSISGAFKLTNTIIKYNMFRFIINAIELAKKEYPDYIIEATSDSDYGYFISDPIKLKYEAINDLLICVDYGDGTWEWRWRKVNSLWYGGLVKQTAYEHVYPEETDIGYENDQPTSIDPFATARVEAVNMGHAVNSALLSSYSFENQISGITYFSWYIAWKHIEDSPQSDWAPIGNSNLILVEIDDINLNYIFDWEIESARLEAKTEVDEEGAETKIGGENIPDIIELEVLNDIQADNNLPPSFCILKPIDDIRYRFFNSVWELYISYKYKIFSNNNPGEGGDNIELADYVSGGYTTGYNRYGKSPYDIGSNTGIIDNITTGPIGILGYFYDENGRIVSTNATKALVNITREICRPVEIKYEYYTVDDEWVLTPESGFCIDIAEKRKTGQQVKVKEIPACGDHEGAFPIKWDAPMWFPYDFCRGFELYDEWTICNRCQSGYIGPINDGVAVDANGRPILIADTALKRNDFRYCGPHKYKAFGAVRDARPTPCNCACVFYYVDSRAATVNFSGFCNIREQVDEIIYRDSGWVVPPYGNKGRDFIERYLSIDYEMYFDDKLNAFTSWLPLVMDHSALYFPDFNCFVTSTPDDTYYALQASYSREPFLYTNQLNYFMGDHLAEYLLEDRYRFDDVFEIHHEGNCSYPKPKYIISGVTKAVLYHFKDVDFAWAWQEYWKDIERASDEEGRFRFLELERPKYRWNVYKKEHRFITDEGNHTLVYTPPELDTDGNMINYPTIGLDGGKERPFEIIYPEGTYSNLNKVIWKDVGGASVVDGSSDDDNIYEKTMQDPWIHDIDTVFDITAVTGTENANQIVTSVDGLTGDETINYYNTGLIANITRDKLDYLPKNSYELIYVNGTDTLGNFTGGDYNISVSHDALYQGEDILPGDFNWDKDYISIIPVSFDDTISIYKLNIKGLWGSALKADGKNYNYIARPAVSIAATFVDDSTGQPRSNYSAVISEVVLPENEILDGNLEEYVIELKFALGPLELIGNKKIKNFSINITGYIDYFICINNITLTIAELKTLDNSNIQTENIKVWERKYNVSKMTGVSHNLDGPEDYIQYDLDRKKAGQYFPFAGSRFENEEFDSTDAQSKMRSVACGIRYTAPVSVPITYDTVKIIELEKQRDIYNWASKNKDSLGDALSFSGFTPPKIEQALLKNGVIYENFKNMYINSDRLIWELQERTKRFKQYDFWRPGGHSYEWSQYWRQETCFLFDSLHTIFEGDFRHYDHPYGIERAADTAVDILNSYYNLRLETVIAKAVRNEILNSGGNTLPNDLLTAANPFSLGI